MSLWTVCCINDVTARSWTQQQAFINLCGCVLLCVEWMGVGWNSASLETWSDLDVCEWTMGEGEESCSRRRCNISSLSTLLSGGFPQGPQTERAYTNTASISCVITSQPLYFAVWSQVCVYRRRHQNNIKAFLLSESDLTMQSCRNGPEQQKIKYRTYSIFTMTLYEGACIWYLRLETSLSRNHEILDKFSLPMQNSFWWRYCDGLG